MIGFEALHVVSENSLTFGCMRARLESQAEPKSLFYMIGSLPNIYSTCSRRKTYDDSFLLASVVEPALEAEGTTVTPAMIPSRAVPMAPRASARVVLSSVAADMHMTL